MERFIAPSSRKRFSAEVVYTEKSQTVSQRIIVYIFSFFELFHLPSFFSFYLLWLSFTYFTYMMPVLFPEIRNRSSRQQSETHFESYNYVTIQ